MTALSPLYLRPDSDEGPALLTVPQAARYCNIGKTAAYEM
jgi:hypothetical protein